MIKIVSWNVNGVRAIVKKGFFNWLQQENPDILCLQETKIHNSDLTTDFLYPQNYNTYWHSGIKKGYSGVSVFTKIKPLAIKNSNIYEFDNEGRVQIVSYEKFDLINAYFPNSQALRKRLDYKLKFNDYILKQAQEIVSKGKNVIVCGDYNVAHKPIDLSNPKDNENSAGYYIEERQAMSKFIANGYLDVFRYFCQEPNQYTWWSYRTNARQRNVGWRIDYFCVNKNFINQVLNMKILADVYGSDHCPIMLLLK